MSAAACLPARRSLSWRREVLLFVGAYLAYSLARGAASASFDTALTNARLIIEVQARLGIGVERAVQEHLIGQPVMWVLNRLYLVAQFAVVPAGLVWIYRRRPHLYPRLRTTVLATWLIALPVYAFFPTAPPRLAGIGILDTVSSQTSFALDSPLVTAFYNPVAAVPSLHAGFAFAIGIGVAASTRRLWLRFVGLGWGPAIGLVVIATGNHFVLDVLLGLLAVAGGFAVALLLHRAEEPHRLGRLYTRPTTPRRLRVALVCPYDWHRPGGVRTHVAGLAEALRARGHSVDVLAAGKRSGSRPGLILVGATTPVRANGSVARIALGPCAASRTRRALEKGAYDVVHVHEPVVPLVSRAALRCRGTVFVGTFHMYSVRALPYRLLGVALRRPLRALSAAIAVSESARACATRLFHIDAVIPNGIWTTRAGAAEIPGASSVRRVLFIGRHEPRKGLAVLLEAFRELPDDVFLDLVGVQPDEVARQLATSDQTARIVAHGRISDEERHRLLRRADVLCAPSLHGESFGLVLAEAMAEAVPVVASAIPGYCDVLDPRCGRLVPPGDPSALAAALNETLADAGLRDRLRAVAQRASAPFAWERVSAQIEGQYRRALHSAELTRLPEAVPVSPAEAGPGTST